MKVSVQIKRYFCANHQHAGARGLRNQKKVKHELTGLPEVFMLERKICERFGGWL